MVTHGWFTLHAWCEERREESRTDGRRERERHRQNRQMGKCWEGKNCSVLRGVKTLLCKGRKKSALLKRLKGENTTIEKRL